MFGEKAANKSQSKFKYKYRIPMSHKILNKFKGTLASWNPSNKRNVFAFM